MDRLQKCLLGTAFALCLGTLALLLAAKDGCHGKPEPPPPLRVVPHPRIVSLAPATTEALFALGLGEHVVGVSRFCDFPPEVAALPRVGGLTDVDVEAIVRLLPDVVVAPRSQLRARDTLVKLGVEVLSVQLDTLPQIFDSLWVIGEALDRADVAAAWMAEIEALMVTVRSNAPQGDARPSVLVCVGRDTDSFERVYIAGASNFYSEILEAVGGRNAYAGEAPYPMVSGEGIVRMNPDIIIDIVPEVAAAGSGLTGSRARQQWRSLPSVRAIEQDRVQVITEPWAVRPGPRIGFLVQRFAQIVQQGR